MIVADSKSPAGVAEVPVTDIAAETLCSQIEVDGPGPWLVPSPESLTGYQQRFNETWQPTPRKAEVPYCLMYDLCSAHATRISAGGVADEWATQMLRQPDAKVFKKYS